jgi:hypothetical protein
MKTNTTTMENSMETPQNSQNRTAMYSSHTTPRDISKECKSGYNKGTCTPMFTAALFTIVKL